MTTEDTISRPSASLDEIFHPRSVAVVGVSKAVKGFSGVSLGFLLACKEAGCENLYPVNPKYDEIEGLRCYPGVRDIPGPVDHVISCVPVRVVDALVDDCIAKGVRSIHFFTAGFTETGDEEMAAMERRLIAKVTAAGIRAIGPNCMGLYVPGSGLAFMPGSPVERGAVGFVSQSGGNAGDMIFTSAVRGIRYSKVVSYGNAADLGESELLDYLAGDPETEVIATYVEGVRDGRRFFSALKKAAAIKPVVILKGGRTAAGTRAVMSHTASLAGSAEVFAALCRQVNAVSVNSVDEMVDVVTAFRFMAPPEGRGVAVVGGGGGFSVHAADEIDEAGLECPPLPADVQAALSEFTPAAGTSVRNPVDTMATYDPPSLERTIALTGGAPNIHAVMFHASVSLGAGRRALRGMGGFNPEQLVDMVVDQVVRGRDACGVPVVIVLRPPLDVEGMERASVLQERLWRAGFPVFPSIPRAGNAIAKLVRWYERRAGRTP